MLYQSTRNSSVKKKASEVIAKGISEEGGLFVPENLPDLQEHFSQMAEMNYRELAKYIFSKFLTDFTPEEISACVENAYASDRFNGEEPVRLVPLTKTGENKYLLELWHGPTCAFKDMALQILPHFLTVSLQKTAPEKQVVILVATSGDTGKAALEGFRDVPDTKILVFYPQDGVSPMQQRQMCTQEGDNVFVCAVKGNFDDAQTGVKQIFTDKRIGALLDERNMLFSSANSINWGRLLPQVVYYFYSYFDLFRNGTIKSLEEKINIAVPTGNFGNILAAYYASKMGLPVKRFLCASNSNNVLTDFIRTGVYDRRREFYTTSSPSMDILVSSNLERLLYVLAEEDCSSVSGWMEELASTGKYEVNQKVFCKVKELFFGGFCDDNETAAVIRELLEEENYLCDPHTAVAVNVYRQYLQETGDTAPTIIASTASPYKFVQNVLGAVADASDPDEFSNLNRLELLSHTDAPSQLRGLKDKTVRFTDCITKEQMAEFVLQAVCSDRS